MNDSNDSIFADVRAILVDVLMVDEADVQPSARFFQDLGGESIDVLDLQFKCAKHFGVNIEFQALASDPTSVNPDGTLTSDAIASLKGGAPYVDFSSLEANPRADRLSELFTVSAIAGAVRAAIVSKNDRPVVVRPA